MRNAGPTATTLLRCLLGATGLTLAVVPPLGVQQGAAPPPPLVKEGVTTTVAAHTYVIPDGNVGLVPNVGIVVGSRATLVVDTGLGPTNGEAVMREVRKRAAGPDASRAPRAWRTRKRHRSDTARRSTLRTAELGPSFGLKLHAQTR